MNSLEIMAPAKINWGLRIVGRRPDGYHLLRSLMQSVDVYDKLTLTLSDEDSCTCSRKLPEYVENIALRAWCLLKAELGLTQCLHIDIQKQIPLAAGLGGGSTDAAAVLRGANRLLELGLSLDELTALAQRVGADVPFCLTGGLALVEGIGERVTKLDPAPPQSLILLNSGLPVSTPQVYAAWDEQGGEEEDPCDIEGLAEALTAGDLAQIRRCSRNSLEAPAFKLHRSLPELRAACAEVSTCAHLSGSGGTVWALCPNQQIAQMTARALQLRVRYPFCRVVSTLNGNPD